ncbi:hypothetical protein C823_006560 [Eubacterium plexicaudatum ASF492]|nr:hypothetical protein C823_006560 [Eubacterium plexicaudatum ASF492]
MIKVVKFGGSSLASAEQFRKVRDILLADKKDGMLCRARLENATEMI